MEVGFSVLNGTDDHSSVAYYSAHAERTYRSRASVQAHGPTHRRQSVPESQSASSAGALMLTLSEDLSIDVHRINALLQANISGITGGRWSKWSPQGSGPVLLSGPVGMGEIKRAAASARNHNNATSRSV